MAMVWTRDRKTERSCKVKGIKESWVIDVGNNCLEDRLLKSMRVMNESKING